jgi:hypothetical protein
MPDVLKFRRTDWRGVTSGKWRVLSTGIGDNDTLSEPQETDTKGGKKSAKRGD